MARMKRITETPELSIEIAIHTFLRSIGIYGWTNDIKGYFNKEVGSYTKNNNPFIERGISDISFLHKGQFVCIEVKRPSEMKSADRSLRDLQDDYTASVLSNQKLATQKKKKHRFEQRLFLNRIIEQGGIGFFACSVDQVKERLQKYNFKL